MGRRKSAFEEAQEAALNFALGGTDDSVSVISFESASEETSGEEATISKKSKSGVLSSLPSTATSMLASNKRSSLNFPQPPAQDDMSPKRNSLPTKLPSEDAEYQWARARALASAMQIGLESSDDDHSLASSNSGSSTSTSKSKTPKRKESVDSDTSKAAELFNQMRIQSGKCIVSRRSLPPTLTRYSSGESTSTGKSAQSFKSFPPTIKRCQSTYTDPRHRKDYAARPSIRPVTRTTPPLTRMTRATSNGTSASVSSMSSSSFQSKNAAGNNATVASVPSQVDEKDQERRAAAEYRRTFLRSMEERIQMRVSIKERRYDEENQQRNQDTEDEENKPPSDNELLTAETQVAPSSVDLNDTQSLTDSVQGRKILNPFLLYSLLGIIAIATIAILVMLIQNNDEVPAAVEEEKLSSDIFDFPQQPNDVLAVVPETICMEQVPGDGWSTQCTPQDSMHQGGAVCNLVAQSYLDIVKEADIAFQSSTSCLGDIVMGNFTVADAYKILPHNVKLWNLQVTGYGIYMVLEQVLESTFGVPNSRRDYPYAAGLRFTVNASAPFLSRVTEIEVNKRLENYAWEPLEMGATYTLVASQHVMIGGDTTFDITYQVFEQAYKEQFPSLAAWKQTTKTLIEYAQKKKVLRNPPSDTYSTMMFIP